MISDNKMRKKKKIIKDIRKRRIKTKECGKKKGKKRREPMLIRMKCDLVAFLGKSDTFLIDVQSPGVKETKLLKTFMEYS